jgi:hypothetical protein
MPKRNSNRKSRNNLRNFTPILKEINETVSLEGPGTSSGVIQLVLNDVDGYSNLSVKNFCTNLICELPGTSSGVSNIEEVGYYIMFVPEGYTPAVNFPFIHPEWILNYSYVGTPLADNMPVGFNIRKTTKRARKLKPGDQIVLFVLGTNTNSGAGTLSINGLVKYYSKRN